jgi:hypothetical protein
MLSKKEEYYPEDFDRCGEWCTKTLGRAVNQFKHGVKDDEWSSKYLKSFSKKSEGVNKEDTKALREHWEQMGYPKDHEGL